MVIDCSERWRLATAEKQLHRLENFAEFTKFWVFSNHAICQGNSRNGASQIGPHETMKRWCHGSLPSQLDFSGVHGHPCGKFQKFLQNCFPRRQLNNTKTTYAPFWIAIRISSHFLVLSAWPMSWQVHEDARLESTHNGDKTSCFVTIWVSSIFQWSKACSAWLESGFSLPTDSGSANLVSKAQRLQCHRPSHAGCAVRRVRGRASTFLLMRECRLQGVSTVLQSTTATFCLWCALISAIHFRWSYCSPTVCLASLLAGSSGINLLAEVSRTAWCWQQMVLFSNIFIISLIRGTCEGIDSFWSNIASKIRDGPA